tara:strand:- start:38 stop:808 length:771 start_codon:yes stop_codon:yes gene_type:complete
MSLTKDEKKLKTQLESMTRRIKDYEFNKERRDKEIKEIKEKNKSLDKKNSKLDEEVGDQDAEINDLRMDLYTSDDNFQELLSSLMNDKLEERMKRFYLNDDKKNIKKWLEEQKDKHGRHYDDGFFYNPTNDGIVDMVNYYYRGRFGENTPEYNRGMEDGGDEEEEEDEDEDAWRDEEEEEEEEEEYRERELRKIMKKKYYSPIKKKNITETNIKKFIDTYITLKTDRQRETWQNAFDEKMGKGMAEKIIDDILYLI